MTNYLLISAGVVVAVILVVALLTSRRSPTNASSKRTDSPEDKQEKIRDLPDKGYPSDHDLRAQLLKLKEKVIDPADGDVPEEQNLLRDEMVMEIVRKRPQNREEFLAEIPLRLRQGSRTTDSKHIQMITDICSGREVATEMVGLSRRATHERPKQTTGTCRETVSPVESRAGPAMVSRESISVQQKYPDAYWALEALFGRDYVRHRAERLDTIYQVCADAWSRNLERFGNTPVRYVLISEAPPWREAGENVSYFYLNLEGAWCTRIVNAMVGGRCGSVEDTLSTLAAEGFLLIDSLPFACDYSRRGIRASSHYQDLVTSSMPYFYDRFNDPRINWSPDVRAALAYKKHGEAFIKATSRCLPLSTGGSLQLSEALIAADKSGYTNGDYLRKIYTRG